MSCDRNQPCRPDPIEDEARAIGRLLDNRQGEQAANYLREDSYNMPPAVFNKLVNRVMENDRQGTGNDLYRDRGDLVIDMRDRNGNQLVVATRDFDAQRGRVANHRRVDDRWNNPYDHQPRYEQQQRGYDPRNGQQRDVVTDTVVQGVVGAAAGAAINGRKGALAGGAGAVAGKMVDQIGGPNNRDAVTDTVVKGVVGGVVGGAIDGNKGAKAGAAGAVLGNILERMQNR